MKKNHCDVIIDEYLDLKCMSNQVFCNISYDIGARNIASDIRFAMNKDQQKVLE